MEARKWWGLISAGLMALGALGPWITAFGTSVNGLDGKTDGWVILLAAVVGGLAVAAERWRLAGVAGLAATVTSIYDYHHLHSVITHSGVFAEALVHTGWGLELAIIASISLGLSGAGKRGLLRQSPTGSLTNAAPPTVRAAGVGDVTATEAVVPATARFCPQCGTGRTGDNRFCVACGTPFEAGS
jgi:4-amino-4-deoxy-L-arabinose transferase-like glycosyltransferase